MSDVIGLRRKFKQKRCFSSARSPIYPPGTRRPLLLEVNPWASHRLISTIAAIILREHLGYEVDLNGVLPVGMKERLAKTWAGDSSDGDAVRERLGANDEFFGYANLEYWVELQVRPGADDDFVASEGLLGYNGRAGWFVSTSFVDKHGGDPEFYRTYSSASGSSPTLKSSSASGSSPTLKSLAAVSEIDCAQAGVCCCNNIEACNTTVQAEVQWCPTATSGKIPAVLAKTPLLDAGFNEELAHSNGLHLGLRLLGEKQYDELAKKMLRSDAGQIVHAWHPSVLLSQVKARRILFPAENCGVHRSDGTGNWSCDFPSAALMKYVSVDVTSDPVAHVFFSHVSLPEYGEAGDIVGALKGAGMHGLLLALGDLTDAHDADMADAVFRTACNWVMANEVGGIGWISWIKPRHTPFFADTLSAWYPYPAFSVLLAVCILVVFFMEYPFLWTTLSCRESKRIQYDGSWRTSVEVSLRKLDFQQRRQSANSSSRATIGSLAASYEPEPEDQSIYQDGEGPEPTTSEGAGCFLASDYHVGLAERAVANHEKFWKQAEADLRIAAMRQNLDVHRDDPMPESVVRFVYHTRPCMHNVERVSVPLRRGASTDEALVVEVQVEECDGGAKKHKDFKEDTVQVYFAAGQEYASVEVEVKPRADKWLNTIWFQARLVKIIRGSAKLATPATVHIIMLSDDPFPANIPERVRGGHGLSLLRYFLKEIRMRRTKQFDKTMRAMLWLPVHSVFVSVLVQKVLVDHAVRYIGRTGQGDEQPALALYWECAILAFVQLVSLALNRWADVVQTRNRGRTGGVRQTFRLELLRKHILKEHSEHWQIPDNHILYTAIYDMDVITGKAYFQVFILAQSCLALVLSILLVVGLSVWDNLEGRGRLMNPGWFVGILVVIPMGLGGAFFRRKMTWVAVIARRHGESKWFKACTTIILGWDHLYGLTWHEREVIDHRIQKLNKEFIPRHWDCRDTLNDTQWVMQWLQGISYCFILLFGTFALIDATAYGVGDMQFGTFYAMCSIYLKVGKYTGKLCGVFVHFQQATVSLREVSAMLSQRINQSQRLELHKYDTDPDFFKREPCYHDFITLDKGLSVIRPTEKKNGRLFAELMLNERCELPLGRVIQVTGKNEMVLRTFLGLIAKTILPSPGKDAAGSQPRVIVPQGLTHFLLPMVPVAPIILDQEDTKMTVIEGLRATGAPEDLCVEVVRCVGLKPQRPQNSLGPGTSAVFALLRALLSDPDVILAYRPLAVVPQDIQPRLAILLRIWQGCGGLPGLAKRLGVRIRDSAIYRPRRRTLIVGNGMQEAPEALNTDHRLCLDDVLWKSPKVSTKDTHDTDDVTPVSIEKKQRRASL